MDATDAVDTESRIEEGAATHHLPPPSKTCAPDPVGLLWCMIEGIVAYNIKAMDNTGLPPSEHM